MTFVAYFVATLVLSYVISSALAPKPTEPKPAAFDEVDFPQAEEGTPQSVVFGDCWISDWTVLALGDYRTTPIKKSAGGKK